MLPRLYKEEELSNLLPEVRQSHKGGLACRKVGNSLEEVDRGFPDPFGAHETTEKAGCPILVKRDGFERYRALSSTPLHRP